MVTLNCFSLKWRNNMNKPRQQVHIYRTVTGYWCLDVLELSLTAHPLPWNNQPGITHFPACNFLELYQGFEDCVHPQRTNTQNPRNLKKQTIYYEGKPLGASLCSRFYLTIQILSVVVVSL